MANVSKYLGHTLAVVDETSPAVGAGVYYVVTSAILNNPEQTEKSLEKFFSETPNRTRPFHWTSEGANAKKRMIELIGNDVIEAKAYYRSVGRKAQKYARDDLLKEHIEAAALKGVTRFVIEAGDFETNRRDKDILSKRNKQDKLPFEYEWCRKEEKVLWIADAFCGTISDYFRGSDQKWFKQLESKNLIELEYK